MKIKYKHQPDNFETEDRGDGWEVRTNRISHGRTMHQGEYMYVYDVTYDVRKDKVYKGTFQSKRGRNGAYAYIRANN